MYIAEWTTALVGMTLAIRGDRTPAIPLLLTAIVAVTQRVALAIVSRKGERLILPSTPC